MKLVLSLVNLVCLIKFAKEDEYLNSFFSEDQMKIICEAIEDHRASGGLPRSIYGKIVSDADKEYDFDKIIIRCIEFRLELDFDNSFSEVRKHILNKYSTGGYFKGFYLIELDQEVQGKFDRFCVDDDFALSEFKRIYYNLLGKEVRRER